ncbi:MAG: DNA mismatch repair protein MutS [Clostridia bacterium]|nr:DNA mismatch repair protein MutS [Clostridia bacterium]
MAEISPMMRQYLEIKEQNRDTILFFRVGDFYEMFYDDALLASKELELTLTGKDCGLEERAPMCGVPFHAAQTYISRLVAKGYKVAVCEQTENPAEAKGLVRREIIRVVTPGTNLDDAMLNSQSTNYIAAIVREKGKDAVVFADVASGELSGTVMEKDESASMIINELARFSPVEIALGGEGCGDAPLKEYITERMKALCFSFDKKAISQNAEKIVGAQLRNAAEIEDDDLRCAAAAVISYIIETQKAVPHMREILIYTSNASVEIDAATRRNLELTETMRDKQKRGSLYGVLDKTKTAMGSRVLKGWILRPLVNAAAITNRLNAVEEMVKDRARAEDLAEALSSVGDVERLMARVSMKMANARDLASLRNSFASLGAIKRLLSGFKGVFLAAREGRVDELKDVYELLDRAIVDEPPVSLREGSLIKPGYDERIDSLKKAARDGKDFIAQLEVRERERTGIKNLKVGFNKVFGYYIDVSKSNLDKVPEDYIRKQTLVNNERFVTLELKEAESAVLGAQERLIDMEYDAFVAVREAVAENLNRIMTTAKALAETDAIYSLAEAAVQNRYVKPTVNLGNEIVIKDGRHPVVEKLAKGVFVPNDTYLNCENDRAMVITGPNMAGKSTYMRQSALIVLMAQMGSFVPAGECSVGVIDKLFTRIGASDDLTRGQSTFMLEMSEVSYILANATKKSLVIFDEVGHGTSTFDGLSIAWAVMEYMVKKVGAKTMFATHYHELAALEGLMDGVKNYNTACKKRGDDITFLRKIVRGQTDDSYGIEVAKLAGVPNAVIKRAKEILREVESGTISDEKSEKKETSDGQIGFETMKAAAILEELKELDATTLTPIEAMNKLYELCNKARG